MKIQKYVETPYKNYIGQNSAHKDYFLKAKREIGTGIFNLQYANTKNRK